jgi:hypothetical protein
MAKTPTPEMIATQRTVPERVLLFCLASGTSRVKAVTHATAQHMLVRNLFARSRGGGLRAHPSRPRRTGRVAEVIAGDALPPSRLRSTSASSKGGMGARGPMNGRCPVFGCASGLGHYRTSAALFPKHVLVRLPGLGLPTAG